MNLVLDIGNTVIKLAVFHHEELLHSSKFVNEDLMEQIALVKKAYPSISKGIVSNVGSILEEELDEIDKTIPLHRLSNNSKIPFNNKYKTPATLGVDRIALVSAAVRYYGGKDVLIIDAGTCITFDFINAQGTYLGGAISPGLRIRYESLHNFTAKLPLLVPSVPKDLIGDSTENSIHTGIVTGICRELDGIIDDYKLRYPDLTVILTGGDAKFLSDQLKNSIFANSNFLMSGLNYLLDYNTLV